MYNLLMNFFEFLALAVLLACVVFLIRRNVIKVPRFRSPELTGWPLLDANLILITEIVLMSAIFTMNACDQLLQAQSEHYTATGTLFFSSFLMPLFSNLSGCPSCY